MAGGRCRAASVAYAPGLLLSTIRPWVSSEIVDLALRALKQLPTSTHDRLRLARHAWAPSACGGSGGHRRHAALDEFYDEISVYGSREIFDVVEQYRMPDAVAKKVRYCGYIGVEPPERSPEALRDELDLGSRKLVVVTVGGIGLDEGSLLTDYLDALDLMPAETAIHTHARDWT